MCLCVCVCVRALSGIELNNLQCSFQLWDSGEGRTGKAKTLGSACLTSVAQSQAPPHMLCFLFGTILTATGPAPNSLCQPSLPLLSDSSVESTFPGLISCQWQSVVLFGVYLGWPMSQQVCGTWVIKLPAGKRLRS